jgi:hypothetical protein
MIHTERYDVQRLFFSTLGFSAPAPAQPVTAVMSSKDRTSANVFLPYLFILNYLHELLIGPPGSEIRILLPNWNRRADTK